MQFRAIGDSRPNHGLRTALAEFSLFAGGISCEGAWPGASVTGTGGAAVAARPVSVPTKYPPLPEFAIAIRIRRVAADPLGRHDRFRTRCRKAGNRGGWESPWRPTRVLGSQCPPSGGERLGQPRLVRSFFPQVCRFSCPNCATGAKANAKSGPEHFEGDPGQLRQACRSRLRSSF